ncbi:hypothetical protein [Microbacterium sp. KR10-403]|uniref:hypothetical protein n=1 Tax=Microbacterium sp. KR10-403 TaxID=3158581 RepID=UPI0032E51E53
MTMGVPAASERKEPTDESTPRDDLGLSATSRIADLRYTSIVADINDIATIDNEAEANIYPIQRRGADDHARIACGIHRDRRPVHHIVAAISDMHFVNRPQQ